MDDELMHYGVKRRSGRYPWGSGKEPYQHSGDFLSRVESLSKSGMRETEIASTLGLTTTELRVQRALAKDERRSIEVARAKDLREKGYSLQQIADQMGYKNDSSIRSLLNEKAKTNMDAAKKTAEFLKQQIDEKGIIDIGAGVERELNISKEKLKQAVYILEREGYVQYGGGVSQVTNPGQQTNLKVLCPPGTEHKDIYNLDIHSVTDYISHDGGDTFDKFVYPSSLDSKRLMINYAEQGGLQKDGVVEIRRGVPDLDLGKSNYAQVRIMVDGTHYIKGMAVYADDLPKGVDLRFNTNKKIGTPMEKVLKPIKDDPDNPFGSLIKAGGQSYYTDPITGERKLSLINKRAEEGDWTEWSNKLPSQFLSKQNLSLINRQLNISKEEKQKEFDDIMALTNPTIKKALLKNFSDDCDSAAVHLQAAGLPRQKYHVILPVTSMSEKEIYAPNYKDGEQLALVRFPHGGTFEIPIVTVNNKNKEASKAIGKNAKDAVGINSKVAERLSGADFDGDTVLCIPTGKNGINITSTPALKGLEGFDSKSYKATKEVTDKNGKVHYYFGDKEFKKMNNTQVEMGMISNLITDMTLKGASQEELARAVRHSMVVIDAEKHHLDYKQSEIDNDIITLKNRYQGHYDEDGNYHTGASTLLSRAKSEQQVTKRKGSPIIDPTTGKQTWKESIEEYTDKNGKTKIRTQKSTKMFEVDDARKLSSGTQQEEAYADYANKMKSLANEARKAMINTGNLQYSSEAKKQYASEVASLKSKLNTALKNAPKERQAQIIANSVVKAKKQSNPDMTKAEIKKAGQQALTSARAQVGAKREMIKITDKEWEAIQAGAITENVLTKIIANSDMDVLRSLATPKESVKLSDVKVRRMKAMIDSGYTNAQIAEALGISSTTVVNYMKGDMK